jgi:hypothetical protein
VLSHNSSHLGIFDDNFQPRSMEFFRDHEWDERRDFRREYEVNRSIRPRRSVSRARDQYITPQRSASPRSPPARSHSLPRYGFERDSYFSNVPHKLDSSTYRRHHSGGKARVSVSPAARYSDDSFDSLDSLEVSEEEDDLEETIESWDEFSITTGSERLNNVATRINYGGSSNWLKVNHPIHSVSVPSSPTHRLRSPMRSPHSPTPLPLRRSIRGSPPRSPPRPPRIIIGSDGEDDRYNSSSDGMSTPLVEYRQGG